MTVVIADTSPLNYLVLIGQIEILRRLYGKVVVPAEVLLELDAPGAPVQVFNWARHRRRRIGVIFQTRERSVS